MTVNVKVKKPLKKRLEIVLTNQTKTTDAACISSRIQVTDVAGNSFFADPDPAGTGFITAAPEENFFFQDHSRLFWFVPPDNFVEGVARVEAQHIKRCTTSGTAEVAFRSFCVNVVK